MMNITFAHKHNFANRQIISIKFYYKKVKQYLQCNLIPMKFTTPKRNSTNTLDKGKSNTKSFVYCYSL